MENNLLREEIEADVSALVQHRTDLWPKVAAKVASRKRTRRIESGVRRVTAITVVVFLATLIVSPQFRTAVAGVVWRAVSVTGGLTQPTTLSPKPPFVVKQPGYLPDGFVQTWIIYSPGRDPSSQALLPSLRAQLTNTNLDWQPSAAVEKRIDQYATGSDPYLLLAYEARQGQYILLFERLAQEGEALPPGERRTIAGQPARLARDGQILTLTWITDGTWVVLESTLSEADLSKVAETLTANQALKVPPPAGPGVSMADLPFCDPSQRPATRYLLGELADQPYRGQVSIEFLDRVQAPSGVSWGSDVQNFLDEVLKPALRSLKDPNASFQKLPYESINSFTASEADSCLKPNPAVLGYIVIEVWEQQVNIGYGGQGGELTGLAVTALEREIERRESP